MKKTILVLQLLLILGCTANNQIKDSTVQQVNLKKMVEAKKEEPKELDRFIVSIESDAIKKNIIEEDGKRKILIYIPPDYEKKGKEYPVLYYLTGYGNTYEQYIDGTFQGINIVKEMDNIFSNTDKQFILVVVDGRNKFGGSFYVNNPITGNWEDYIVKDVVGYVDNNYRTIKSRDARGIAGHSMGGYGSFNLAIKNSNVFGAFYSVAGGIYKPGGTESFFLNKKGIKGYLKKIAKYKDKSFEESRTKWIEELSSYNDIDMAFGIAFAPNSEKPCMMDLPYNNENDEVNVEIMERWRNGFENVKEKLEKYDENIRSLNGIGIEIAKRDEFRVLTHGGEYLHNLLDEKGIKNSYYVNEGDHSSELKKALTERVIPFFQNIFYNDKVKNR